MNFRKLINELNSIESKPKLNEAPYGVLQSLGNRLGSALSFGGKKEYYLGKEELGQKAREVYKKYKNYIAKTNQEDDVNSLKSFLTALKFDSDIIQQAVSKYNKMIKDKKIPFNKIRDKIIIDTVGLTNKKEYENKKEPEVTSPSDQKEEPDILNQQSDDIKVSVNVDAIMKKLKELEPQLQQDKSLYTAYLNAVETKSHEALENLVDLMRSKGILKQQNG